MAKKKSHSIKAGDPEALCALKRSKNRRDGTTKVCKTARTTRSGTYCSEGMLRKERFSCYKATLTNPYKKIKKTGKPSPVGQRAKLCTTNETRELKKILGYPAQGHHILSTSMFALMEKNNPTNTAKKFISFKNIMRGAGYDVNNGNNVFFLPKDYGHTKWDDIQRHFGNHNDDYYDTIYDELENIYNKYKKMQCNKIDWEKVHKDMHNLENRIFNKLKDRKLWLYDMTDQLFKADSNRGYRSEKNNKTDEGVKWLTNIVRHKEGWYTGRKYPYRVPSNAK